jgi:ABC-type lipoprotein export system ATPase subunit
VCKGVALNSIIQTSDLCKIYHKGNVEVRALQGITFDVLEGEFVSIVGRSGSGKSTLLNLIGGLDTATSGRIRIREAELTQMKRAELARHRRHTVGMIFQSFNLIPSRTASENVVLALTFGGVRPKERKSRASEILSKVGLDRRADHRPGELSGGEAQRVAIARALVNEPDIILADEPTGNLDSKTSQEIIDLLKQLNREQGLTVLMVTHDETSAQAVSHRVCQLLDGKIVHQKIFRSV